jgi:hypothetical protein
MTVVYLIKGRSEALTYPDSVGYSVEGLNGTQVYSVWVMISWGSPPPALASHSKMLFHYDLDNATFVWNQKGSNLTAVGSGNYTITVSLGEYGSNCTIEIRPNPTT